MTDRPPRVRRSGPGRLAAPLVALLLAAGCSVVEPPSARICTLIGCADALTVRLEGAVPAGAWRVELLDLASGTVVRAVECPSAAACPQGARLPDVRDAVVRVRVTTAAGTVTRELRPTYTERRPNGPDCPPVCRNGVATLTLG